MPPSFRGSPAGARPIPLLPRPSRLIEWLLLGLVLGVSLRAEAHGDTHLQIRALSARIEQAPLDASLYEARASLHEVHGDLAKASRDFDRALSIDRMHAPALLGRARVWARRGALGRAMQDLEAYGALRPDDPRGWLLRAEAEARRGQHAEAIESLDRARWLTGGSGPELELRRADALRELGDIHGALESLDAALSRLGPLTVLEERAIELELERRNHRGALARLSRLIEHSARKESWLAKRGEVLEGAGRLDDAREAYLCALEELASLKPRHRRTKAMEALERRIVGKLRDQDEVGRRSS